MAPGATALILVRHAHADWPGYRGKDFSRPLTERGVQEAHAAGRALREAGMAPGCIIASAALRTEQTARILLHELHLPASTLQLLDTLYNADASTLAAELKLAPGAGNPVVLVAHNPGISELAQRLSEDPSLPPFQTAQWQVFSSTEESAAPLLRSRAP